MIIIDAGHGGKDVGAHSRDGRIMEKDLNLVMAQKVAAALTGIPVRLTRTGDTTLDSGPRTMLVRNSGAQLCLSLHHNAANNTARGVEVIYSLRQDDRLARRVYDALVQTGMPGRRVFTRESDTRPGVDYYFMLRDTAPVETIIVEFGFLDHPEDLRLVTNPEQQNRMAAAVSGVVRAYLGVGSKAAPPAPAAAQTLPAGVTSTRIILEGIELPGIIIDGKSYLQVREMERAGYAVGWDGKAATITKGG